MSIIVLQLGQCGNQLGTKFWDLVFDEHSLSPQGFVKCKKRKQNLNVYLRQPNPQRDNFYVPRSVLVDVDLNGVRSNNLSIYRDLYSKDCYAFGNGSSNNTWAACRYTDGLEVGFKTLEIIRKQAEACEYLQGFQLIHGLGGGTGSGLASLLLTKLRDYYPRKMLATFSVIPESKITESIIPSTIVEGYNSLLALSHLATEADQTFLSDNSALMRICAEELNLPHPCYADLNYIVANAMSGVTTCFRFPCLMNGDMCKLQNNMVPFPRLHFFITSYAPLVVRGSGYRATTVKCIMSQIDSPCNITMNCNTTRGSYLSAAAMFRGKMDLEEVEEEFTKTFKSRSFVDWVSRRATKAVCELPPRGSDIAVTLLANTTAMHFPLRRARCNVREFLKRKAYFHLYTADGMEASEMDDAATKVLEVATEYQLWQSPDIADDLISQLEASPQQLVKEEISLEEN